MSHVATFATIYYSDLKDMDELYSHFPFHLAFSTWHNGTTLARDVRAFASSLEHDKAHGARANERREGEKAITCRMLCFTSSTSEEDELDRGL